MNLIKRLSLLLAAVVLTVGAMNAQFRFGIKAGLNLSNLHLTNSEKMFSKDNKCGYTAGVMTEFEVPIVGLCLDASLMFTHMNENLTYDGPGQVSEVTTQETNGPAMSNGAKNFFQVPINVKYKFQIPGAAAVFAPYLFTGPDFAFKLGGKDDFIKTKTFQCAWNIGLGFEVVRHLQISGSYAFGINNVMDKFTDKNLSNDIKLKNNYWTITAAYLF